MLSARNNQYGSGRARSGTAGSEDSPQTARPVQTRPPHLRSQSYLSGISPVDPKPRNAVTMPAEASPPMHKKSNGTADKAGRQGQGREDESYASSLLPRLHLPGHRSRYSKDFRDSGSKDKDKDGSQGHHFQLRRSHSHRHTKSEVPRGSNVAGKSEGHDQNMTSTMDSLYLTPGVAAGKAGSGMLARVTTNLSSRPMTEHKHKPRHQYSSSDVHKGFHQAAAAALTGNAGRPDLRRRATSDPRAPAYPRTAHHRAGREGAQAQYGDGYYGDAGPQQEAQKPMSEVEVLFYKAEKAKREAEENVSEADVQKLTTQLAESNVEMQDQLASTNRTASSLMRRLDDAHDALLRTASSLIDTISSFQNLCQQSSTLIKNFENKTSDLDDEMRATLEKQRTALFDERGKKVAKLEERGKKANDKAEEMSRRLENCRMIVKNYTERQQTKRRAWKGVIVGSLWGCAFIVSGLLLGFVLWWYKNYGNIVRYDVHEAVAMALDHRGLDSVHGHLHEVVKERLPMSKAQDETKVFRSVPDDVKAVLEDIATRHNGTIEEESATQQYVDPSSDGSLAENKKLKKLFDKLEL